MDNPGQFLIHFTNRGPNVSSQVEGQVGNFKVNSKQPLKDINKFGLLHYSVPKMCDHLDITTASFILTIHYVDGAEIDIPVTLPALDYYNMLISQEFDSSVPGNSVEGREKLILAFDEVLQTSINWAIMENYDYEVYTNGPLNAANNNNGYMLAFAMSYRLSCIVDRTKDGYLRIRLGYRGSNIVNNVDDPQLQAFTAGVTPNTGNPFEAYRCVLPSGRKVDGTGNLTPLTIEDDNGNQYLRPNDDPLNVLNNGPATRAQWANIAIAGIEFQDLSQRMQMFLGANSSAVFSTDSAQPDRGVGVPGITVTRGRIRLKNYIDPNNNNLDTNIAEITFPIKPNLDPPSFMYLQLTVPGTRSKILGQLDERGGWAIPTPPNLYMSNFINFPANQRFHVDNVRYAVNVFDTVSYNVNFANKGLADGIGFNYDFIPLNANNFIPGTNIRGIDNYNTQTFINPTIPLSGFLRIGKISTRNQWLLPKARYHRSGAGAYAGQLQAGFGCGLHRQSPVFTVSLVEPNYIFTSVENATMQTFDVRLMWGDTSEEVRGLAGNPVQFSLIASP